MTDRGSENRSGEYNNSKINNWDRDDMDYVGIDRMGYGRWSRTEDDFDWEDEDWWFDEEKARAHDAAKFSGTLDLSWYENDESLKNAGPLQQESKDTKEADTKASEKKKTSKKKKSLVWRAAGWIIPAGLGVVFVYSSCQFVQQYAVYRQARKEYEELDSYILLTEDLSESSAAEEGEQGEIPEEPQIEYPALDIDYDALKGINDEFVGVLYIPVLDLHYPVTQGEDDDKYLHTTFEGTYNASGCIYLNYSASPDFGDSNTFIFGHNMKNGTMFGSLKKFLRDETLCDEDPYIYIYQEDQVLVYRIFAYYTIPVRDDVYDDFEGEDGYDSYVADAGKHSVYQMSEEAGAEIDWASRPHLLTLSTCYATGHVNNFVVQGVLIGTAHTGE